MSKAEEMALKLYTTPSCGQFGTGDYEPPEVDGDSVKAYIEGYHQAEKDVAEAFAKIIRGNLGGIGNGIQNMFEQLYTDITGERMYEGFKD